MAEKKSEQSSPDEAGKLALRKELDELLSGFKNPKGIILKGIPYLQTEKGKRVLELMLELKIDWNEAAKILNRSQSNIEKALSFHKLKKSHPNPEHILWTPERLNLVHLYYAKSKDVSSKKESGKLRDEMIKKVNELPGHHITVNAIRAKVRNYEWGSWGFRGIGERKPKTIERQINVRVEELVNQGVLAKEGVDALYQKTCASFPHDRPSKKTFRKRVEKVLWEESSAAKKRDQALQGIVRVSLDPEKEFYPRFPYIPLEYVKMRARWHRGVNTMDQRTERALPGIGRVRASKELGDLSKFQMPQTSFKSPFTLSTEIKKGDDWTIMFLNGANIGTRHGRDIVSNPIRRALSDADERRDTAVILTNIIALDLKKAGGPVKVGRELVMGANINPKIFADPEYRATVERILKENPKDEIIYETSEELLDNILSGWTKICIKPNKKNEFGGTIFIILGANEEEIIHSVAYWELNYWTRRKQLELRALLSVAESALKEAEKKTDWKRAEELEDEIDTLQERCNRTIISNASPQEWHRFYEQARALVVRKVEQAVPNSKVIGQGGTYVEIGGEKIEVYISGTDEVTDTHLARYTGQYGPKNLREQLAPTVVICHPWSLNCRFTFREADYDGKRGSTKVFVAPIAVDDKFLRTALKETVKKRHPLARAVFNETFKSGVLRLNSTNGIVSPDVLSIESLESFKKYKKLRVKKGKYIPLYGQGSKYIWNHTSTDQHWGGRAKEFVTCNLPGKNQGMRLGVSEAVFEMMRFGGLLEKDRMPIHLFSSNDDGVQGQNYHYRTELDPHQQSFAELEKDFLKTLAESKTTEDTERLRQIFEKAGRRLLYGLEKRGSDFPHEQMFQMINRHVIANADIFSAILKRNQASGIVIKGVGEFGNADHDGFDSRNVGAENFPSGNHLGNTIGNEILEGPFYAVTLRNVLRSMPEWHDKTALLEKLVVAPLYGSSMMAWGTIKAPGGYEYGLDLRATPPRMAGWADPLLGAVRNDPLRGNYSRIFNGRMTLKTYGDKHFFAGVFTQYALYHMCASGTHTDPYGERGFPPNNTGVSFVGLPVDGPESGPLLIRILPFDVIKDFVETNPRPFDWEKFLPNPLLNS